MARINCVLLFPFLSKAGAIRDDLVGEKELAQYFLAIFNLSNEYKKWEKMSTHEKDRPFIEHDTECLRNGQSETERHKQHITDHTQVEATFAFKFVRKKRR